MTVVFFFLCLSPSFFLSFFLVADLNVGGSSLSSALCDATGASRAQLRSLCAKLGDPGDAAMEIKGSSGSRQGLLKTPPPLTLRDVYSAMTMLAQEQGQGSAQRRHQVEKPKGQTSKAGD